MLCWVLGCDTALARCCHSTDRQAVGWCSSSQRPILMIFLKIALTSEEMLQIYNDVKKKKIWPFRKQLWTSQSTELIFLLWDGRKYSQRIPINQSLVLDKCCKELKPMLQNTIPRFNLMRQLHYTLLASVTGPYCHLLWYFGLSWKPDCSQVQRQNILPGKLGLSCSIFP